MSAANVGFRRQFGLLLRLNRQRAVNRAKQNKRAVGGGYGIVLLIAFMTQFPFGFIYSQIVEHAALLDQEQSGRYSVEPDFLSNLKESEAARAQADAERKAWTESLAAAKDRAAAHRSEPADRATAAEIARLEYYLDDAKQREQQRDERRSRAFDAQALRLRHLYGGSSAEWRTRLDAAFRAQGSAAFTAADGSGPLASRVASLMLIVWWLGLVLQGEGFSADTSRRRYPMWEWYMTLPVSMPAVFVAEAIGPLLANPFLLMSPFFVGVFFALVSQSFGAFFGGCVLAIPFVVLAALWSKTLETLVLLRSSVRNRSAWFLAFGTLGMFLYYGPVLCGAKPDIVLGALRAILPLLQALPAAGSLAQFDDLLGFLRSTIVCTLVAAVLALPALGLLRAAVARGLETEFGGGEVRATSRAMRGDGWLANPLLHKELLWLRRDRGTVAQLFGAPLAMIALQAFNFHNMTRDMDVTWNRVAGVVVGFGAIMLFQTGPRALLSEGAALATTLTWPRSLEDSLRMKVRLLFALVTAMVWLCLALAAYSMPGKSLPLLGVALLWPLFGFSIAEKAVTLIQAPAQSGETEPVAPSRVWLASLGNLTFAIGLFTRQWQLVFAAIALNWAAAGALWQGFRHRLPYLFDPESEPQLPPPTILSGVLGVLAMLEIGAVVSIPFVLIGGPESLVLARMFAYAMVAAGVCVYLWHWQNQRGVDLLDIVRIDPDASAAPAAACVAALLAGAALGGVALGYMTLLHAWAWPELRQALDDSKEFLSGHGARIAYAVAAVGVAPWAEEYLFRGILFRAMQGQWGTWRAALASSAFFAVLHPATAWPMVFALGALNCCLFLRSRALLPCVLLHFAYNAVICATL